MIRINRFFRESPKKEPVLTVTALSDGTNERWKPPTLRRPFLLATLLITLALLVSIQTLVIQDKRNEGVAFASKISDLGPFETFLHAYLPTILAVLYSLVWSWIDLDVKRIEPYRQLSMRGGASGRNSLLLQYPYDFLGFVPFTAFKRRHWPVFASSCALVLVVWGITPLQGAIFAVDTVTKSSTELMEVATHHLSIAEQAAQVTANYTYSTSNIVWLGERMPAFMSREAALSPFRLSHHDQIRDEETWTAVTTSFSVDVDCEEPTVNQTAKTLVTSQGCRVPFPFGPDGTDIIGSTGFYNVKEFSAFYAGNQNYDGLANYYLSPYCPKNATNVFMAAFSKNRKSKSDPAGAVSRVFCETNYVQREVTARIRSADGSILNITSNRPASPLPPSMFNTSLLEWQINVATQQNLVRSPIPSTRWPDQDAQLSKLPLTLSHESDGSSRITGLAVGADPKPLEEYLNPQNLAQAFREAHRLLFARAMTDVLSVGFDDAQIVNGTRIYQTEALRIVPGFAFAIEALLAVNAVLALFLLVVNWNGALQLQADPESISALMTLVGSQEALLQHFSQHDQSDSRLLEKDLGQQTFSLGTSDTGAKELRLHAITSNAKPTSLHPLNLDETGYPAELSRIAGVFLTLGLVSALAGLVYVFHTGQGNGLSLPSQNLFVRQMLENYAPTLIATIIEPIWTLLNRILCTLQPFDGLRTGKASAKRTLDLSYTSLPPQLAVFRALKARHLVLVAVCVLTFLANVLAVAFSGMLNEERTTTTHPTFVMPRYEPHFMSVRENVTGSGPNAFYTAMANFTSSTPMPAWTNDNAFYAPVAIPSSVNVSDQLQVSTTAFMLDLDCVSHGREHGYSWNLTVEAYDPKSRRFATITIHRQDESTALACSMDLTINTSPSVLPCSKQTLALEIITPLASNKDKRFKEQDECQQLVFGMWARKPADQLCDGKSYTLQGDDATTMICRPTLTSQSVNLTVSGDGRVNDVRHASSNALDPNRNESSVDGSDQIVREAMQSLSHLNINTYDPQYAYSGIWSNDSFPSSWDSYTMINIDPTSRILDPDAPAPSFEAATELFSKAYRKVFAIWISLNHEHLLAPTNVSSATLEGAIIRPEVRIMVSRSMVILSATILALYVIVTLAVYTFQPAKFLPRMPTTIASDIALFAASQAVREQAGRTGRDSLDGGNVKFGYGGFVGTDGELHIGIERAPFVNSTCIVRDNKASIARRSRGDRRG